MELQRAGRAVYFKVKYILQSQPHILDFQYFVHNGTPYSAA